ncbi:MAG: DNA modification methylase [Bacteroidetes bacterium]|nr:DNA modification methylase [Bacteroidota bacterium]
MTDDLTYIAEGLRSLAVPIDDLHIDPANARKGHALDRIASSLKAYGQRKPIIANRLQNGKIEAGNGTWLAAKRIGWSHIAVVFVEDDPATAAAYGIADNRLSELSEWDLDALGALLPTVDDLFTGFTDGEIRDVLGERGDGLMVDPGPQDDHLLELCEKWQTASDQAWQLGKHTLVCADTMRLDIGALQWGGVAALAVTSPPYWVGKDYEREKSVEEIEKFIAEVARVIASVVRVDESRIVINTGTGFTTSFDKRKKRQVLLLIDKWANAFYPHGWNLRHVRHWLKEGQVAALSPKSDLIDQHSEFIGAFEHDDGLPLSFTDSLNEQDILSLETFYNRDGKSRGQGKTNQKWALRSYWNDIKGTAGAHGHVAAFPLEIPARHILLYTRPDEVVFDPFSGSGTSLIACEILNRVCWAAEIDPHYVAATLERWHLMTGKMPERK